jgi:rhamnose utilization protein RhaD (predicted bifunctional aldolase and dehydrogenase)
MNGKRTILNELVTMSRYLGDPSRGYAILGEGNTSARSGAGTFYVKASGVKLGEINEGGFVEVRSETVLNLLKKKDISDEHVKETLMKARVNQTATVRPSVETFLHASLLEFDGINFIGHTHPVQINAVVCSKHAEEAVSGALFPDQIVYCGYPYIYVPYIDPGAELAKELGRLVNEYRDRHGYNPKAIFMQNHGFIAVGSTSAEIIGITDMAVKSCEVLTRAWCLGGPNFLSESAARRIGARPDEQYRKKKLQETAERRPTSG